MKTTKVPWTINKNYFLMLLFAVMSITNVKAQAQNPPQIQWKWIDNYETRQDWIFQCIESQSNVGNFDGYVGCGYTELAAQPTNWPSMEKVDANGITIWKKMYNYNTFPSTSSVSNAGNLKDIIQTTVIPHPGQGLPYKEYIAVGNGSYTNGYYQMLFVRVDMSGDETFETFIYLNSPYAGNADAHSILEYIEPVTGDKYYYIYGSAENSINNNVTDIVLIKVDELGNFIWQQPIASASTNSTQSDMEGKLNFWRDGSGVIQGLLITGGIGGLPNNLTNGIIVKTDLNGIPVKRSDFDGTCFYTQALTTPVCTTLTSLGYQRVVPTIHCKELSNCITYNSVTNIHNGYEAKQIVPGGNIILSARINWLYQSGAAFCDLPILNGEYMSYESVLFLVDINLDPLSARSIEQFEGKDYHPEIEIEPDGVVLLGAKTSNQRIQNYLGKFDFNNNFNLIWKKIFNDGYEHLISRPGLANCPFSLTKTTTDNGYLVCGNNELDYEDYSMIKLVQGNCPYDVNLIAGVPTINLDMQTYVPLNGEVIDQDVFVGSIVINPGVTLAITKPTSTSPPTTVYFSGPDGVIIQKGGVTGSCGTLPGGKLLIDGKSTLLAGIGATLTGGNLNAQACTISSNYWQGIQIEGDALHNQLPLTHPLYQGMLEMKNAAEISKALNATAPWNNMGGGLIRATNSKFTDNFRSAWFMPYMFNERSLFNNCIFDVSNNTPNASGFISHIYLWQNKGAQFIASEFKNTQTGRTWDIQKNKAIYSLDAGYSVVGRCGVLCSGGPCPTCPAGNLTPCKFTGFNIAIDARGSGSTNNVIVDWCEFGDISNNIQDNVISVQIDKQDNCSVTRSKFYVGGSNISSVPGGTHEGIIMKNNKGYRIEENELQAATILLASETNGIRIRHDNYDNGLGDRVYKNNCYDLTRGEISEWMNRSVNGIVGLQFLCNGNYMNNQEVADVFVTTNGGLFDGIRNNQGDAVTAAGNIFSHIGNSSTSDYFNDAPPLITYFYSGTTADPTYPLYHDPLKVDPQSAPVNTCPSNFSSIAWVSANEIWRHSAQAQSDLEDEYDAAEEEYINVLYSYSQLIDGGSTTALLEEIENTWPEEAWTLRNELMALAPYVSEEALRAAAMRGILPDAMLLEICLANPDATRSDAFIEFLRSEIPNPLPESMLDLIIANWSEVTPRTILERSLAHYSSIMGFNSDLLLADLMLDDEENQSANIRYWLGRRDGLIDRYMISASWIEENNFVNAMTAVNNILNDFKVNDLLLNEYNNYLDYLDFRNDLYQAGKTIMQLNAAEIAELDAIADASTGNTSRMARNILCFGYGLCDESGGGGGRMEHYVRKTISESEVTTYPNPASTFAAINWNLKQLNGIATLNVTDVMGRKIEKKEISKKQGEWIWDTRRIENGVYLYEIISKDKHLAAGKIVVKK